MTGPQGELAMIVAASTNDVIGSNNELPWRISADLKRFKSLTMGHHLVMGRKTFESIGRLLPGRQTVIVTRQEDYTFAGALIAHSLEEALSLTSSDDRPFLVGGAELYRLGLEHVTYLHLTRIHAEIAGDAFLPPIDWSKWQLEKSERHSADAKNEFDYSFEDYLRRS